jgi:hypothetical protein
LVAVGEAKNAAPFFERMVRTIVDPWIAVLRCADPIVVESAILVVE